jgi:hypothetical protein
MHHDVTGGTTMAVTTERPKVFYSLPELIERWGVSERTIQRETERGRLKRKLIGGRVKYEATEVERYERTA